jgi:hypothetical protein
VRSSSAFSAARLASFQKEAGTAFAEKARGAVDQAAFFRLDSDVQTLAFRRADRFVHNPPFGIP